MRLLVKFRPGVTSTSGIHAAVGGTHVRTIPGINVHVVEVPDVGAQKILRRYQLHAQVQYAEVEGEYQALDAPAGAPGGQYVIPTLTPNDPHLGLQWAIPKIQCPEAWDVTQGENTVIIAILDTGIDEDHPDLVGKVIGRSNFSSSPDNDDHYGHGTHCAGISAALTNNGEGVAGVAPMVKLLNGKVLGDSGSGSWSGVAEGIVWAADQGAHVISMSLGGSGGSSVVEDAVNYAWSKGVVVVAAAGNSGSSTPSYPAFYTNCIAVAATDQNDQKASFSNFGDWVDIAAPGVSIYASVPPGPCTLCDPGFYRYLSGTSMACPHVAGVAALVFPLAQDGNGDGNVNDEVRRILEEQVDLLPDKTIGSGRLNAFKAVSAPAPPPTGTLVGKVAEAETNLPIAGATVTTDTGKKTATFPDGSYSLSLAAGTYSVTAEAPGYGSVTQTVQISEGQTSVLDFSLTATPPPPPPPPTTMWVAAITAHVPGRKHLMLTVQVTSNDGPVANATGEMSLTGPADWKAVFATGNDGEAKIMFKFLDPGLYRATITGLVSDSYQWDNSKGVTFIEVTV